MTTGLSKRRKWPYAVYLVGLFFLLRTKLIIEGVNKYSWGYYPKAGILHPIFLCAVSLCVGYIMVSSYKKLHYAPTKFEKKQIIIALAAGSIFSCSSYDFLLNYEIVSTYPYGFIFSIIFILLISYGAIEFDIFSTSRFIKESKEKLTGLEEVVEEKERDILSLRGEIIQREKMASLGLLAAGVAHQLGNTLNTISTTLIAHSMSIDAGNLKPEFYKNGISRMMGALKLSKDIIVSISYVGRENDVMQMNDLNQLVDSGIILIKGKSGERVKFVNRISRGVQVYCSKSSIVQVFMNLFSNSIDALNNDAAKIEIYLEKETDALCEVAVSDNGKGIPDSFLSQMFKPFATTKPPQEGTGLGLYLVKKEINKNNGSLRFTTGSEGTIFYISLPKVEQNCG